MSTIRAIECRLYEVPLAEVLTDAKHGEHTHFELVTATVTTDDGIAGTGYTYTGGKGGRAGRSGRGRRIRLGEAGALSPGLD